MRIKKSSICLSVCLIVRLSLRCHQILSKYSSEEDRSYCLAKMAKTLEIEYEAEKSIVVAASGRENMEDISAMN